MEELQDCKADESSHHNIDVGKRGEEATCLFLEHEGFEIIERNWRCPSGEADIIAIDGENLVFVEVKTRSSESTGLPEEAVTREKRRRYEEIALAYLRSSTLGSMYVRFDVASVTLLDGDRGLLRYHRNAFGTGE